MEKNSIHSQLTNDDPRSGAFEIENRPEEPQVDPMLAAEEELAGLMEQIEEVKMKIQMMEDKRGMESDALEDLEPWRGNLPDPRQDPDADAVYNRVQQRQNDPYDPDYR
jgi:hypothetical protein